MNGQGFEAADRFAAVADPFERLWTPHRMAYIGGDARPATTEPGDCPFCAAPDLTDEAALIVRRSAHCFAVLNLFPYNPGHLLICPYRHVADLVELSDDEASDFMQLTRQALTALRRASQVPGFNLGINAGPVAGAGIAGHLHQHVVPRWSGDSNFFPIIAQTKAIPVLLAQTRAEVAAAWPAAEAG